MINLSKQELTAESTSMPSASDKREFSCCPMDRKCIFIVLISLSLTFSLSGE